MSLRVEAEKRDAWKEDFNACYRRVASTRTTTLVPSARSSGTKEDKLMGRRSRRNRGQHARVNSRVLACMCVHTYVRVKSFPELLRIQEGNCTNVDLNAKRNRIGFDFFGYLHAKCAGYYRQDYSRVFRLKHPLGATMFPMEQIVSLAGQHFCASAKWIAGGKK